MFRSAHAQHLRADSKMGNVTMVDTMISDGLTDVFNDYYMGITAQSLIEQYQISRADQDAFAVTSQSKATANEGASGSRTRSRPLRSRVAKGDTVVDDDHVRAGATIV